MSRKKPDKKTQLLKPEFQNILICKKKEHRPFLEILIEEPENISRKNLGVLVGIFQINDYSEDSSYIVNYLISVIKKEYFSHINHGSVENFEAALHKANLALAKLASHENIDWIGNLNAVCAVIEKNNILISQTGTASVFLLRKTNFIEITESTQEQSEISPLKTFQDVISGKIEKDDKIIFTTKEIFELFSLEEIKRSALKFSQDNFIQFLNTALINELDQVATLIVDVFEQEDPSVMASAPTKKTPQINAFSQTTFRKKEAPRQTLKESEEIPPVTILNQNETTAKSKEKEDFIDKKNGHIYMKEELDSEGKSEEKTPLIDFSLLWNNFITSSSTFGKSAKKQMTIIGKSIAMPILSVKANTRKYIIASTRNIKAIPAKLKKKKERTPDELEAMVLNNLRKEAASQLIEKPIIDNNELTESLPPKTSIYLKTIQTYNDYIPKFNKKFAWLWEGFIDISVIVLHQPVKGFFAIKAFLEEKKQREKIEKTPVTFEEKLSEKDIEAFFSKDTIATSSIEKDVEKNWLLKAKQVLPDFSRLKDFGNKFNSKQKLSAILILFMLLIVPYWIAKWANKTTEEKTIPIVETAPIAILPLEKDKNVIRLENLNELYSGENIQNIINLKSKLLVIKSDSIINLETQKNIPIPADFKNPDSSFIMQDLNTIFLIKNNQLSGFTPSNEKFATNNLAFPTSDKITDIKTYLTYLYILDKNNNQIYRYPKTEGGFNDKSAWISENIDLSNSSSMTINQSIFVINNNEIIKFFSHKRMPFSIEETATPIMLSKIFTAQDITNLYILDNKNSRIIKLDADGNIVAQYYNEKIATANVFSVSEENNLIYISNGNGVESFNM
ncbi:MAG: hypothetical protein WAV31_02185 [Candidatus Moraniibacteriota bacterium]